MKRGAVTIALIALLPLSPRALGGTEAMRAGGEGQGEGGASRASGVVTTRLEKPEVRLGEPFHYEIEVKHPAAEHYALPSELSLDPFRATRSSCRREERGGGATTTCTLQLALFQLGPHDVPAIALEASTPDGPAPLEVRGPRVTGVGVIDPKIPARELALRDPAGPVPLLVRTWHAVWWTLAALALAAVAAAAFIAWKRRAGAALEPPPPLPAHVRFARRLDALEAERLPERGLGREHVARASELVREYLAAVTGEPALDLTSGELLDRLEAQGDPRLDLPGLRAFLGNADLVKFAKADAGAEACAAATAFARALLARTAPPAAPEPEKTP